MGFNQSQARIGLIGQQYGASGTRNRTSLNAAYSHLVSGNAVACRYVCRTADPINEIYVLLDAFLGTLGNITMGCLIYNEHASVENIPGSTLRATASAVNMPSAADKWIQATFASPYTPAVGEILWFVFYNSSAAPTVDYPELVNSHTLQNFPISLSTFSGYTTTNGFTTAGTAVVEIPFGVKQGTMSIGRVRTLNLTGTNNTRKRGNIVIPRVNISVCGVVWDNPGTTYSGFEIFDFATGPGGTPLWTFPLGTDTNQITDERIGQKIWAPVTLQAGLAYRCVLTYGTANTQPSWFAIEDYASYSSFFDGLVDGHHQQSRCIDDGAGGWTDSKDGAYNLALIYDGLGGGGGGAGLLGSLGMQGGMQ